MSKDVCNVDFFNLKRKAIHFELMRLWCIQRRAPGPARIKECTLLYLYKYSHAVKRSLRTSFKTPFPDRNWEILFETYWWFQMSFPWQKKARNIWDINLYELYRLDFWTPSFLSMPEAKWSKKTPNGFWHERAWKALNCAWSSESYPAQGWDTSFSFALLFPLSPLSPPIRQHNITSKIGMHLAVS